MAFVAASPRRENASSRNASSLSLNCESTDIASRSIGWNRGPIEALIVDMRNDASDTEIDTAVDDMHLDRVNAFLVRATFKNILRKHAYSLQDFQVIVAATPFCE